MHRSAQDKNIVLLPRCLLKTVWPTHFVSPPGAECWTKLDTSANTCTVQYDGLLRLSHIKDNERRPPQLRHKQRLNTWSCMNRRLSRWHHTYTTPCHVFNKVVLWKPFGTLSYHHTCKSARCKTERLKLTNTCESRIQGSGMNRKVCGFSVKVWWPVCIMKDCLSLSSCLSFRESCKWFLG